jgi:excisionase family DNA binding protein
MGNDEKQRRFHKVRRNIGQEEVAGFTDHELLDQYLALSNENRAQKFPDTEYAAKIVGLSRRTIQFWVETGAVRAVCIGRKYRVSIDSLREYLKRREDEHWR